MSSSNRFLSARPLSAGRTPVRRQRDQSRHSPRRAVVPRPAAEAIYGIDRLVHNIEHGRFERMVSALTAAGAAVTTAEIFFEHDKASFGNPWMWAPIVTGPIGVVAGTAGFLSKRMAKTALPVAALIIVSNGVQGVWLHAKGIGQKPGGWRNFRYNMEMGPPLMAPLLVTLVGGMGLLAALLRRER